MNTFAILETALTGLRVIRANPGAFLVWTALSVVISILFGIVVVVELAPSLALLSRSASVVHPDPAAVFSAMRHMAPFYGIAILFTLVLYPVVYAALNRVVLRPDDRAFAFLRLGGDEGLQLLLLLLLGVVLFAVYLVLILCTVVVTVIVSVAVGGGGVAGLGAVLGALLVFVILAALLARLSLASPATFVTGKVDLFASWSLTRGLTWRLLAVGLVCLALSVAVQSAWALVGRALFGTTGLSMFTGPEAIEAMRRVYASPSFLALQGFTGLFTPFLMVLWVTPPAEIYRRLTSKSAGGPFF